ncbi:MAG: hypothetical protein K8U57_21675 [Planctomycetes bacterium]|nr:hypothetical protein [Planctomycetota bacterium]
MLHYPKIPGSKDAPNGRCVAFEKLDGTNLHWCWERDFGWHAFGTRRDEFDLSPQGTAAFAVAHPGLEEAPGVFLDTVAEPLAKVFREHSEYANRPTFKVFTEFLGPNSFAGRHEVDDPKETVLIDVWADGFGFVGPEVFVADFGHLPIPRIVFRGKLTGTFLEAVRRGKSEVTEGVVCKGGSGTDVWMVKVKTFAYLTRLKAAFGTKWEAFWE